jgi:hypothetical protein
MDPSTKPIQRESLRDLLDASRSGNALPHVHTVRRDSVRQKTVTGREPSALRGLVMVLVLALGVRQLLLWIF